jgi:hypothetical protein
MSVSASTSFETLWRVAKVRGRVKRPTSEPNKSTTMYVVPAGARFVAPTLAADSTLSMCAVSAWLVSWRRIAPFWSTTAR